MRGNRNPWRTVLVGALLVIATTCGTGANPADEAADNASSTAPILRDAHGPDPEDRTPPPQSAGSATADDDPSGVRARPPSTDPITSESPQAQDPDPSPTTSLTPPQTTAPPTSTRVPAPSGGRVIVSVGLADAAKWGEQFTVPGATIIVSGIRAWGIYEPPGTQWDSVVPNLVAARGLTMADVTDVVWTTADWMNGTATPADNWIPAADRHISTILAAAPNATVWVAPNRPVSHATPGGRYGDDPAAWVRGEWELMRSVAADNPGRVVMGPWLPDLTWPREWFASDGRHWMFEANAQIASAWSAHLA